MPGWHVFQQSHHIVQVSVVVHRSHDIASVEGWVSNPPYQTQRGSLRCEKRQLRGEESRDVALALCPSRHLVGWATLHFSLWLTFHSSLTPHRLRTQGCEGRSRLPKTPKMLFPRNDNSAWLARL